MYKKKSQGWLKHLDFAIFDLIILVGTYVAIVAIRHKAVIDPDLVSQYTGLGLLLVVLYLLVAIIGQNYKSILQRNRGQECFKVFVQVAITILLLVLYMFITKQSAEFSRITFVFTGIFAIIFICIERILYKKFLRTHLRTKAVLSELLIITDKEHLEYCVDAVAYKFYNSYKIKGIVIVDKEDDEEIEENNKVLSRYEVLNSNINIRQYVLTEVVDEVLIDISDSDEEKQLTKYFLEAGITVHIGVSDKGKDLPNAIVETIGDATVITTSNNAVSAWQLVVKRIIDIIGGIVGCIIVGILYLILAPQIKAKEKGPAFFKQKRIGKNGRQFYIYKFRSMYLDAEERKKDLMSQNEMEGYIFKMENDPRILPGIGEKIRKASLDEFPQFINVLKGDMSLVGTRPPTVEEFSQYEVHHKMRLSFKPGITGLWQVSGRNNITNFEEIVALDNEYIKKWNIRSDIKILFKTIKVVIKKEGSK